MECVYLLLFIDRSFLYSSADSIRLKLPLYRAIYYELDHSIDLRSMFLSMLISVVQFT